MLNYFDLTPTDYEYMLSAIGTDVVLNGSTTRVLITNKNPHNKYDDRNISSLSPLKRGDLIEYDGKRFMIISEEAGKRYNKYKGIMRLLSYSIPFNVSCSFFDVPAFIETQSFGIQNGQIMTIADGQLYLNVPDNSNTQQVNLGDRFIKHGQAFKIVGIDQYSKPGLTILTCDKDIFSVGDDVVNEIAGGLACTVEITNTEPIEVYNGAVVQLTWDSKNAPVVFTSSDESIATVDASRLVTGVGIGQAVITVQNASRATIIDSVTISVIEEPVAYTITITSTNATRINEIKNNQSKTYTANVYNGSTLITDGSQPVTWQVFADDQSLSTTLATITASTGTTCTVKNNAANSGYIQLKATLHLLFTVVGLFLRSLEQWRRHCLAREGVQSSC